MWIAFFGSLVLLMLIAIGCFELLIYRLYTLHPVTWKRVGSPYGFGQPATWIGIRRSWISRHQFQKDLVFHIPEWCKNDCPAYTALIVNKVSLLAFLAGTVGFVTVALLLS